MPVVTSLWSDVTYGVHETHCERIGQLSDLSIVIHLLSFGTVQNLYFIELYSVSEPAWSTGCLLPKCPNFDPNSPFGPRPRKAPLENCRMSFYDWKKNSNSKLPNCF